MTPPPRLCLRPVVPGEVRAVGGSGQPFPAVPQWLALPKCDVSLPLCWPPGPLIPCTQDLEPQGIRDACPSISKRTRAIRETGHVAGGAFRQDFKSSEIFLICYVRPQSCRLPASPCGQQGRCAGVQGMAMLLRQCVALEQVEATAALNPRGPKHTHHGSPAPGLPCVLSVECWHRRGSRCVAPACSQGSQSVPFVLLIILGGYIL